MPATKLMVVLGATGNQGGSVVDTFLQDPAWRVRGITRNATSAGAQALAARGVEVVEADLDAPATLARAFAGGHAIFAVTNFTTIYSDPANRDKPAQGQQLNAWAGEHEKQQLIHAFDAAAAVPTLERLVISSLSNATKWSHGKYTHVYHFDGKANAEEYAKKAHPGLWAKTSILQAGYFLSNFVNSPLTPHLGPDGVLQFVNPCPEVKMPWIVPEEDSGPFVKALVHDPVPRTVIGYREYLTYDECIAAFSHGTGRKSDTTTRSPADMYAQFPPDLAVEMKGMFDYNREFGFEGGDPTVIHPHQLVSPPKLAACAEWFQKQDWSKIVEK